MKNTLGWRTDGLLQKKRLENVDAQQLKLPKMQQQVKTRG